MQVARSPQILHGSRNASTTHHVDVGGLRIGKQFRVDGKREHHQAPKGLEPRDESSPQVVAHDDAALWAEPAIAAAFSHIEACYSIPEVFK